MNFRIQHLLIATALFACSLAVWQVFEYRSNLAKITNFKVILFQHDQSAIAINQTSRDVWGVSCPDAGKASALIDVWCVVHLDDKNGSFRSNGGGGQSGYYKIETSNGREVKMSFGELQHETWNYHDGYETRWKTLIDNRTDGRCDFLITLELHKDNKLLDTRSKLFHFECHP